MRTSVPSQTSREPHVPGCCRRWITRPLMHAALLYQCCRIEQCRAEHCSLYRDTSYIASAVSKLASGPLGDTEHSSSSMAAPPRVLSTEQTLRCWSGIFMAAGMQANNKGPRPPTTLPDADEVQRVRQPAPAYHSYSNHDPAPPAAAPTAITATALSDASGIRVSAASICFSGPSPSILWGWWSGRWWPGTAGSHYDGDRACGLQACQAL